jgi:hydrogenase nickel incorporation protein HypA/HybF
MHELSVAQEIIRIVQDEMETHHLTRVNAINVRVGVLSGLNPDALSFGFEASVVDTPLEGARLVIESIPLRGTCRTCGKESDFEDIIIICPHCGSGDVALRQGEELEIASLEGE